MRRKTKLTVTPLCGKHVGGDTRPGVVGWVQAGTLVNQGWGKGLLGRTAAWRVGLGQALHGCPGSARAMFVTGG